jgi:hypothetical protein
MANTTFNGPVRSENGFEQISVTAGTGAVTTNLDIDTSGNLVTTGYVSSYDNVVSIEDATYSVESTHSGFAQVFDPATAGDTNTFIPDASDDDTIDLGSAAQGWLVGGIIRLKATTAAVWHCEAFLHGDGTLATPFE